MYQETTFVRFGTPLPPLEEDAVPAKKPVAVEDQIVTDENGRRRFHGAFTGGFSAGYWNTVGSQEGWTPQSFKSSRSEKAEQRQRLRPEDFMDEEDKGQFGIAPQQVQAREEFTADETAAASMRKRKFAQPGLAGGPIPGVPVLHELLTPIADKVAVRILMSMGWRPGQGVGPRQTRREKKRTRAHNKRELYLMQHYGCAPEDGLKASNTLKDSDDDSDSSDNEDDDADDTNAITFAPDDYDPFFAKIKDNRFGLGYSGLSREPVLSKGSAAIASAAAHINLFGPLEVLAKDNKTKLSISGQAFGVGALEEEDDDIYERDDMTKYDFSLEDRHKPRKKVAPYVQDRNVLEGFVADTNVERYQPHVYRVELPIGFKPRNWAVRKTRFEPLDAEKAHDLNLNADFRRFGLGRHDLNPQQRGKILGEALDDEEMPTTSLQAARAVEEVQPKSDRGKELLERISAKTNSFTRGGIITTEGEEKTAATATSESAESVAAAVQQENKRLLANAVNKTKSLASIDPSSTGGFKPFLNNEEKQLRYEQFLIADLHDEQEISVFCATMQPVQMSPWDREMEKKEFIQARKIYKPLGGIMSDRFVSEAAVEPDEKVVGVAVPPPSVEAAKDSEKKKITMERTRTMWKPCALLCKRYNIAEPYGGNMLEETKPSSSRKAKLSVFDYLESSINTKANFQTPVIIPKHIEKPKAIIKDTERAEKLEFLETTVAQEQKEVIVEPPPRSTKTIEKSLEYVPKSELEKLNVASMHKAPSEKLELFKAIFEDSDDDATIASDADQLQSQPEADLVQPPLTMPKTAAAANLLRNTSPPRGIFAALFTAAVDQTTTQAKEKPLKEEEVKPTWDKNKSIETSGRIAFKSRRERLLTALPDESIEEAYGPIIPTHLNKCNATMPESDVDRKLLRLIEMKKSSEAEEWVEKSAAAEDSSSDSSDGGSDSSSETSKPKKKPKKSKSKKHKTERVRKHKKKDKRKSKKREKSSHKKSKKSSHS